MRLDKFTLRGQEAIQAGIELAERNQNQQVEPEHLLCAMLEQAEGVVRPLLGKLGANVQVVLNDCQAAISRFPRVQGGQQYFSPRLTQVFTAAQKQAEKMQDEYISTEHLLVAIAEEKDGESGKLLRQHGVNRDDLLKVIEQTRGGARVIDQNAEANYQALAKYARDLTDLARQGKLDPVIGRDDEIRRTIQVLSRRTKNNPVLIGEPGVGKTAIVEGLAQRIYVGEPSVEDTIAILRGLKERYEVHHGVRIKDSAIVAAATLSNRYISDRFLPDKAIDLIDEAASRLRIEIDSLPQEIDQLEREIIQLEIERQALQREEDEKSKSRLKEIEQRIADLKEKSSGMKAQWQSEKEVIERMRTAKAELEQLKLQLDQARNAGDLGRASEIQYGKIPELEQQLKVEQDRLADFQQHGVMLKEEVDEEDVAQVVAKWTGIPVSKMLEGEMHKLVTMEEKLSQRVIGQEEALAAVANAVRRARAGLQDPNRPVGSFIFLGPTGVGKTETARALAEFLFDDERAMVRLDMSEYMEKHAVARMIGAPPGYVGYEEGGQLTEAIRRRPYAVILFDEIEKAHPDVFNVLLQILDDGRLTDSKGRTVDFKNTVLIMTSNLGSREIQEVSDDEKQVREAVTEVLREHFKPEFLNRIDDIVIFHRLSRDQIAKIIDVQLERLRAMLHERNISLVLEDSAKQLLAREGYDPNFGARPLKRAIQALIQNPLAMKLLRGEVLPGQTVFVSARDGEMKFTTEVAAAA